MFFIFVVARYGNRVHIFWKGHKNEISVTFIQYVNSARHFRFQTSDCLDLDLILDQCAPPYIHTRGFLSRSKKTGQVDIAIKQSWLNAMPSSIMRLLQKLWWWSFLFSQIKHNGVKASMKLHETGRFGRLWRPTCSSFGYWRYGSYFVIYFPS